MLCRMFELIPIKIRFFYKFLKLLKNRVKVPVLYYRVFGQISSKMKRREFPIFIIFSDTYTCPYVNTYVFQMQCPVDYHRND